MTGLSGRLERMSHRGFRLLFPLDAIVLFTSMLCINWVRFGTEWPSFSLSYYLVGFAIATIIHP